MAFCRLVFPLLVLSAVSCYASKVPLYMWGVQPGSSLEANPLETLTTKEFNDVLDSTGNDKDTLTVVFVEETLSVEDFSHRASDGQSSFPYLKSVLRNAVYLPSVEDALEVLKKRAGKSMTSITLHENGLSEEIPNNSETGNVIFINLKDALEGETRPELLERHDTFMKETVSNLKKNYNHVVAVYTARFPSWSFVEAPVTHSRTRRAAGMTRNYKVNGLGLYVQAIVLKTATDTVNLASPNIQDSVIGENNMTTKFNYENGTSLTLIFTRTSGYWYFNSVVVTYGGFTETLSPTSDEVYAIEGFSYRCGQEISFAAFNDTRAYTVIFQDIKVQPFFSATNETIKFGDSFNCVPYFSGPIWACLLVVFFLLAITFYGIMMMLDIRTMDRFDDPKGKTININAGE